MERTPGGIRCNICESTQHTTYLNMSGFSYERCTGCGLVFQNPLPSFDDLRRRYGAGYFEYEITNQENFFNLMKLGLRDIRLDSFFEARQQRRSFLDIGCATGLLLDHMRNKGWKVKGVEICRESADYAMRELDLDVYVGTLEQAAFADGLFDVIHFSHLIEHVADPKGFLQEVKRILKPEGHIVVTTPNAGGFQARVAGKSWRSAIPDHIYLFSKKTMRVLLARTGFRILRQLSWGGIPAGKRPGIVKSPADRLAKLLNVGDVMLFHCTHA